MCRTSTGSALASSGMVSHDGVWSAGMTQNLRPSKPEIALPHFFSRVPFAKAPM